MDAGPLRVWGIAASAAVMAVALTLALRPTQNAQAEPPTAYQVAQAGATAAAPVAFLVRFRGSGPIARAQARAARGQTQSAQSEIEAQLLRQTAFAGLCFDRFTVGASEVVLRTCDPVAASERARVQQDWLNRLRAMRSVEYADANTAATPGRAG